MIAISTPGGINTRKVLAWTGVALAVLLVVIALVYLVRRLRQQARAASEVDKLVKGQTQVTGTPNYQTGTNAGSGTGTTQTGTPDRPDIYDNGVTAPADLPNWMVEWLWKTNASDNTVQRAYKCEVSNLIMTVSDAALRQYKLVYQQWYGKNVVSVVENFGFCGQLLEIFTCPHDCSDVVKRLKSV